MAERSQVKAQITECAFTLIEVTIAVLILASGLLVVLGMQSSIIERTLRDRSALRAMLVARTILSTLEIRHQPLTIGEEQGSVDDILKKFAIPDNDDPNKVSTTSSSKFNSELLASLKIEYQPLADKDQVEEHALKRLTLNIAWGDLPIQSLTVVSYIPNDENDQDNLEIDD